MSRRFFFAVAPALLIVWCAPPSWADNGWHDPLVGTLPLDEWARDKESGGLRWSEQIAPARLSSQQRLVLQMTIQLDGDEVADRPGKGRLLMLVQIKDAKGTVWQDHGAIDFRKVEAGVRAQYLEYTWSAFVLPGDYRVALGVVDTQNHDHGAREERVHVAGMRGDPLPQAWQGLPEVEFLAPDQPPESWYLPGTQGHLNLPMETRRPVQVNVLVNLTPSERTRNSAGTLNGSLHVLLPALKVLSQMRSSKGGIRVTLLDLARQKVTLDEDMAAVQWPALKSALGTDEASTIDVGSLGQWTEGAEFFVSQVRRRVAEGEGQARALVILSSAMGFEKGEDLKPIDASRSPDLRVFYFRYPASIERADRRERPMYGGYGRHGGGGMPGGWRRPGYGGREMEIDQLAPTLKPLAPQVHDIESPEQFRKALAEMMDEIARM